MDKKTARQIFIENNKEIAACGIEKFSLVLFPLAMASMNVHEHIREDYSALEFIVLRLIDAGITGVDFLCKATGLTERMIKNIIENEKDYNHIDDNFNVLEGGKITLAEQSNTVGTDEYVNHKCYENPRVLQFDAISKTVIAGNKKYDTKHNNYAFDDDEEILSKYDISYIETNVSILEITEAVKNDIVNGLYKNYDRGLDVTIDKISDINVYENKIAFAYYVVTKEPKMHLLVIRTQELNIDGNVVISYEPIAIPEGIIKNSNNKYIEKPKEDFLELDAFEDEVSDNDYDLEDIVTNNQEVIKDAIEKTRERAKEARKKKSKQ